MRYAINIFIIRIVHVSCVTSERQLHVAFSAREANFVVVRAHNWTKALDFVHEVLAATARDHFAWLCDYSHWTFASIHFLSSGRKLNLEKKRTKTQLVTQVLLILYLIKKI